MAKVIAVVNQKGGVGKTTTSINLSASLAVLKKKVLLIDFDPQGNATMGCGVNKAAVEQSAYHLLTKKASIKKVILPLKQFGFHLIPGGADLTAAEVELMEVSQRERALAKSLKPVLSYFDFILIDCPPSLNILTVNALVAANSILIPMQCEYYALEGLSALMDTLGDIRQSVNPELSMEGLLRTMYDPRSRLTRDVSDQLERFFKEQLLETCIPRNVRLAEAPSHGLPIYHYEKSSRGSRAYLALGKEIIKRNNSKSNYSTPV